MNRKKTSSKQELSWQDIQEADIDISKLKDLKEVRSESFFKNHNKVALALLECLIDNDPHGYIEILDEYLRVNRSRVAHKAKIGRSTVQEVFSKKGNPTLKTIAKIVHYSQNEEMPVKKIN